MKKALIFLAVIASAFSTSAQSTTDTTRTSKSSLFDLIDYEHLNVGRNLRQSESMKIGAMIVPVFGGLAGYYMKNNSYGSASERKRDDKIGSGIIVTSVVTGAILYICAEVKFLRACRVLERLHPTPNGIGIYL